MSISATQGLLENIWCHGNTCEICYDVYISGYVLLVLKGCWRKAVSLECLNKKFTIIVWFWLWNVSVSLSRSVFYLGLLLRKKEKPHAQLSSPIWDLLLLLTHYTCHSALPFINDVTHSRNSPAFNSSRLSLHHTDHFTLHPLLSAGSFSCPFKPMIK